MNKNLIVFYGFNYESVKDRIKYIIDKYFSKNTENPYFMYLKLDRNTFTRNAEVSESIYIDGYSYPKLDETYTLYSVVLCNTDKYFNCTVYKRELLDSITAFSDSMKKDKKNNTLDTSFIHGIMVDDISDDYNIFTLNPILDYYKMRYPGYLFEYGMPTKSDCDYYKSLVSPSSPKALLDTWYLNLYDTIYMYRIDIDKSDVSSKFIIDTNTKTIGLILYLDNGIMIVRYTGVHWKYSSYLHFIKCIQGFKLDDSKQIKVITKYD